MGLQTGMAEPASTGFVGLKLGQMVAIGAGSIIAGGLMNGPWYQRIAAAGCGCLAAMVLTPMFAPIATHFWFAALNQIGIPPEELSRDSVVSGTAFLIGLTGVDVCRWLIERTKGALSSMKTPLFFTRRSK